MYVYVCMYVCMYIYAHIHTCMHACMHAYIQTYRHIYTQIYVCASALMLLSCMDFCPAIFVFSRSRLKNSCVRSRRFQTSDVGFGIPIQRCKSSRRAGGGEGAGVAGWGWRTSRRDGNGHLGRRVFGIDISGKQTPSATTSGRICGRGREGVDIGRNPSLQTSAWGWASLIA